MISINNFRELAMSFPEVEEQPHFEKASFRIKKKIFATLDESHQKATLKLSLVDQSVFCLPDKSAIYPVPNKWGKQSWTIIDLKKVNRAVLQHALSTAYKTIVQPASKKI